METKKPLILQALEFSELQALDIPADATPEEVAALEANWAAEMETRYADIRERFGAIGRVLGREQFLAEQHDPEINALKRELDLRVAARRRHEAHIERLKRYAVTCLEALGGVEVESEGHTYGLRKNPPSVEIVNLDLVPDKYVNVVYSPDKKLLATDLKSGAKIEGCFLRQTNSLKVKGA